MRENTRKIFLVWTKTWVCENIWHKWLIINDSMREAELVGGVCVCGYMHRHVYVCAYIHMCIVMSSTVSPQNPYDKVISPVPHNVIIVLFITRIIANIMS